MRFVCAGLILCFTAFAYGVYEGEYCRKAEPWKLDVCAQTPFALDHKTALLNRLLEQSFLKKKLIPEKVRLSSQAVFEICVLRKFDRWVWDCYGGSGFFIFDNRTFVTNHHIVHGLLYKEGISDWSEVVFRDQEGGQRKFKVEGVKFLSEINDTAVLEVDGYDGPVLKLAETPPERRSYLVGYPGNSGVKIHSVRNAVSAGDTHYSVSVEIFDCYYGIDLSGNSGGPMLNREGEVEGIFASTIELSACSGILAKKPDFLKEKIQIPTKTVSSIEGLHNMLREDREEFAKRAESGKDAEARFVYALERLVPDFDEKEMVFEAIYSGHDLAGLYLLNRVWKSEGPFALRLLVDFMVRMSEIPEQDFLYVTWYELGNAVYFTLRDLKKACEFWRRAGELGHPYVYTNIVIMPFNEKNHPEHHVFLCEFDENPAARD